MQLRNTDIGTGAGHTRMDRRDVLPFKQATTSDRHQSLWQQVHMEHSRAQNNYSAARQKDKMRQPGGVRVSCEQARCGPTGFASPLFAAKPQEVHGVGHLKSTCHVADGGYKHSQDQ